MTKNQHFYTKNLSLTTLLHLSTQLQRSIGVPVITLHSFVDCLDKRTISSFPSSTTSIRLLQSKLHVLFNDLGCLSLSRHSLLEDCLGNRTSTLHVLGCPSLDPSTERLEYEEKGRLEDDHGDDRFGLISKEYGYVRSRLYGIKKAKRPNFS